METIERTFAQMRGPYNDLIKYFGIYNPELSINTSSDWTGEVVFLPRICSKKVDSRLLAR